MEKQPTARGEQTDPEWNDPSLCTFEYPLFCVEEFCVYMYVDRYVFPGEWSLCSASSRCVPELEFRFSGLAADVHTC